MSDLWLKPTNAVNQQTEVSYYASSRIDGICDKSRPLSPRGVGGDGGGSWKNNKWSNRPNKGSKANSSKGLPSSSSKSSPRSQQESRLENDLHAFTGTGVKRPGKESSISGDEWRLDTRSCSLQILNPHSTNAARASRSPVSFSHAIQDDRSTTSSTSSCVKSCYLCKRSGSWDHNPLLRCHCRRRYHAACHYPTISRSQWTDPLWRCSFCVHTTQSPARPGGNGASQHQDSSPNPKRRRLLHDEDADLRAPKALEKRICALPETGSSKSATNNRADHNLGHSTSQPEKVFVVENGVDTKASTPTTDQQRQQQSLKDLANPDNHTASSVCNTPAKSHEYTEPLIALDQARLRNNAGTTGPMRSLTHSKADQFSSARNGGSTAAEKTQSGQVVDLCEAGASTSDPETVVPASKNRVQSVDQIPKTSEAVVAGAEQVSPHASQRSGIAETNSHPFERPELNYSQLIITALEEAYPRRLTAFEICSAIKGKHAYYKVFFPQARLASSIAATLSAKSEFEKQLPEPHTGSKQCTWTYKGQRRGEMSQPRPTPYSCPSSSDKQTIYPSLTDDQAPLVTRPQVISDSQPRASNDMPLSTCDYVVRNNCTASCKIVSRHHVSAWTDLEELDEVEHDDAIYAPKDVVVIRLGADDAAFARISEIRRMSSDLIAAGIFWYRSEAEMTKSTTSKVNRQRWPHGFAYMMTNEYDIVTTNTIARKANHQESKVIFNGGLILDMCVKGTGTKIRPVEDVGVSWAAFPDQVLAPSPPQVTNRNTAALPITLTLEDGSTGLKARHFESLEADHPQGQASKTERDKEHEIAKLKARIEVLEDNAGKWFYEDFPPREAACETTDVCVQPKLFDTFGDLISAYPEHATPKPPTMDVPHLRHPEKKDFGKHFYRGGLEHILFTKPSKDLKRLFELPDNARVGTKDGQMVYRLLGKNSNGSNILLQTTYPCFK